MPTPQDRAGWHAQFAKTWIEVCQLHDPTTRLMATHMLRLMACTAGLVDELYGRPSPATVPLAPPQLRR